MAGQEFGFPDLPREKKIFKLEIETNKVAEGTLSQFFWRLATNEGVSGVLLIEAAERPGDPGLAFRRRLIRRKR